MSYSFNLRAATKAEAKAKISESWDNIVNGQPVHAKDRPAAQAMAEALVETLDDDDARDVKVEAHGSIWDGQSCDARVAVSLVAKEAPKA